jgi:hypothetical protein
MSGAGAAASSLSPYATGCATPMSSSDVNSCASAVDSISQGYSQVYPIGSQAVAQYQQPSVSRSSAEMHRSGYSNRGMHE